MIAQLAQHFRDRAADGNGEGDEAARIMITDDCLVGIWILPGYWCDTNPAQVM
jgi:hypothetical protein